MCNADMCILRLIRSQSCSKPWPNQPSPTPVICRRCHPVCQARRCMQAFRRGIICPHTLHHMQLTQSPPSSDESDAGYWEKSGRGREGVRDCTGAMVREMFFNRSLHDKLLWLASLGVVQKEKAGQQIARQW